MHPAVEEVPGLLVHQALLWGPGVASLHTLVEHRLCLFCLLLPGEPSQAEHAAGGADLLLSLLVQGLRIIRFKNNKGPTSYNLLIVLNSLFVLIIFASFPYLQV